MIIRHSLPTSNFTRIDRRVFANPNLSDGAKVLYGYLCGLKNGSNYCDKYLMKVLEMSQRSITTRKKELKDADLLMTDRIAARVYVMYIGYSSKTAQEVKEWWLENHDDKY